MNCIHHLYIPVFNIIIIILLYIIICLIVGLVHNLHKTCFISDYYYYYLPHYLF